MPKEINFEDFEQEVGQMLTPEQREWVARLLHDHVSGLVTTISMQVEIVNKMHARGMDTLEMNSFPSKKMCPAPLNILWRLKKPCAPSAKNPPANAAAAGESGDRVLRAFADSHQTR